MESKTCTDIQGGAVKVSVILLAYNQAPYIAQAIDSILMQHTDFAFEVLIGDDASTDETGSIIRGYAERYPGVVIPVIRDSNLGATRNLYDLIECARGSYLAYLEGDDYWCEATKLQQQVDFLESNLHYIACTHQIRCVDHAGTLLDEKVSWISEKEDYSFEDFNGILLAGHGNSLVHRNIFLGTEGRYRDLITMHPMIADRTLCLLLASYGPIHQIQKVFGCYRRPTADQNSATATLFINNPRKILDDYGFTKQLEAYAKEELKRDVDFSPHKKELLFSAVWTFLRKPNKNNWNTAKEMLRMEHSKGFVLYFFAQFMRKAADKLKRG